MIINLDPNLFHSTLDNLEDSLVLVNINNLRVDYVNQAFTNLTGYKPEDVIGRKNFDFITGHCYPENEDTRAFPIKKYVEGTNDVIRAEDKEGHEYWANIRTFAIPHKPHTHLAILSRDITEVYESRQQIKENERIYKAVFNNSFGFILLCDDTGLVIEFNDEISRKYAPPGYSDRYIGQKIWDLYLFQTSKELKQELKSAFLGEVATLGRSVNLMTKCLLGSNDGSQVDVHLSIKPVRHEETGEILFAVVEGRDVSDRLHYEEELTLAKKQYEKILGELSENEKVSPVVEKSTSNGNASPPLASDMLERVLRMEANTASVTGDIKKLRYTVYEDPNTSLLVIRGDIKDLAEKFTDIEYEFEKVSDSYTTTRQVLDGIKKVFGSVREYPFRWLLGMLLLGQTLFFTVPEVVAPFVDNLPQIVIPTDDDDSSNSSYP